MTGTILTVPTPKHPQTGNWTCVHLKYGMTCDELEAMWLEADGRCEVCGVRPEETCGRLYIDHKGRLGDWAVRGFLCVNCNTLIGGGFAFDLASERYLANPWYVRKLTLLGLSEDMPEPARGTQLSVEGRKCLLTRRDDGWFCPCGHHGYGEKSWTWLLLYRRFGPFRMHTTGWIDFAPGVVQPSRSQLELLRLTSRGRDSGWIARRRGSTEGHVKRELQGAARRLGVSGKQQAVDAAITYGFIPAPRPDKP